jgi:transglutaminase-like putative cysteine protease
VSALHQLLGTLPQSLEFVDYTGIDWEQVRRAHYWIYQSFHYDYPGPIYDLHQKLVVVPPARHGGQVLTGHKIHIAADDVNIERANDEIGNSVYFVDLPRVDGHIHFEIWSYLEKVTRQILPQISAAHAARYLEFTELTTPDDILRQIARELASPGEVDTKPHEVADRIAEWVWQKMKYAHGVTSVKTSAAEALEVGAGLCQDYSHIMLTLCRLVGLPARYVSGHLLGEGGSHAWVEVILPQPRSRNRNLVAVPYDPTNRCKGGMRHLTVATGRDYRDVSPTSGYFRGEHSGVLKSSKQAGVVMVEYNDGTAVTIDDSQFNRLENVA